MLGFRGADRDTTIFVPDLNRSKHAEIHPDAPSHCLEYVFHPFYSYTPLGGSLQTPWRNIRRAELDNAAEFASPAKEGEHAGIATGMLPPQDSRGGNIKPLTKFVLGDAALSPDIAEGSDYQSSLARFPSQADAGRRSRKRAVTTFAADRHAKVEDARPADEVKESRRVAAGFPVVQRGNRYA